MTGRLRKELCRGFVRFRNQWARLGVALPAYQLRWLGIDPDRFATSLVRQGITPIFFGRTGDSPWHDSGRNVKQILPPLLQDALHYVLCVSLETLEPESHSDYSELRQQWSTRLQNAYWECLELFSYPSPSLVLVVQGYEPQNAAARAAAITLGIPVLAIENTALESRYCWENISGITTNRVPSHNYFWRHKDIIDLSACEQYATDIASNCPDMKSSEHRSPCRRMPEKIGRFVLFLAQVYTDSSVIFGRKDWCSPLQALAETATWCLDNDFSLVVKLHPKEYLGRDPINSRSYNQLTKRKMEEDQALCRLLERVNAIVDEDNRYNTYDLISECHASVTLNSQAGLEAAAMGKPVIVCGQSFYSMDGVVLEAPSPGLLAIQLTRAAKYLPASALKYAYIYYQIYCRPKDSEGLMSAITENIGKQAQKLKP